jgi:hypothetical protein
MTLATEWGDFPHTVLHFPIPDEARIDLRELISAEQYAILARRGLEQPFGIVTAEDPEGKTQTPARNAKLTEALHHELSGAGVQYVPLDACSPDRSHCEHSVAVVLPCDAIVTLACQYRQLAIFWFDGTRFWIVPALAKCSALALPVHSG